MTEIIKTCQHTLYFSDEDSKEDQRYIINGFHPIFRWFFWNTDIMKIKRGDIIKLFNEISDGLNDNEPEDESNILYDYIQEDKKSYKDISKILFTILNDYRWFIGENFMYYHGKIIYK